MPFYDANKQAIDEADGDEMHTISHSNKYWAPADQGHTRMLKTLTHTFLEWEKSDTGEDILVWRDAAGLATTLFGTRTDCEDYQYNACLCSGEEVEKSIGKFLGLFDIKEYGTLGALVDAAMVAVEKLPAETKLSLALTKEGLGARTSPGDFPDGAENEPSNDWEDQIKHGLLNKYHNRLLGFITWHEYEDTQALFCKNPLLHAVLAHELEKGSITQDTIDTADEELNDRASEEDQAEKHKAMMRVARTVCSALAKAAGMPPFMTVSHKNLAEAIEGTISLIEGSEKLHEGDSEFMIGWVRENMLANAPTVHVLTMGVTENGALIDLLLELAAACPKDSAPTTPKELLTVAGMRKLERQIITYASWAASTATQAMHARDRVTAVAERFQRAEINNNASR